MFEWVKKFFDEREETRLKNLVNEYDSYIDWAHAYLNRKWWIFEEYGFFNGFHWEVPGAIYTDDNGKQNIESLATLSSLEVVASVTDKFTEAWYQVLTYDKWEQEFEVISPNGNKENFSMKGARNYFNI